MGAGLATIYAEPASEPVTAAVAKAHLRLDTDDDAAAVARLIPAARRWIEQRFWLGVFTQTWELTLDSFPDEDFIELPKAANLASITSVSYVDGDGATQTLVQGTDFEADTKSRPGRVRLCYGKSWPSTRDQWNAVVVRYVVGWASVPEGITQAILIVLAWLYENPTPSDVEEPRGVATLMGEYSLARPAA